MRYFFHYTATLMICAAALGIQPGEAGELTALKCGTLLDVATRKVEHNVTVLTENERIIAVEKGLSTPAGATVIDLADKTCLPGLMDMHVHTMFYDRNGVGSIGKEVRTSATSTLIGLSNAQRRMEDGFTTLRIPGDDDPDFGIIDLRDAINQGIVDGPRLVVAPHLLQPIWGYFHGTTENDRNDLVAAGPDAARDAVRNQVRHGADFIKVAADAGGVFKAEFMDMFTDEELRAFVDEAHRLNKRITAHAHEQGATHAAVLAGYDSIEHGFYLTEATAKEMKRRGTWLVPTLAIFDKGIDPKFKNHPRYDFSKRDEPPMRARRLRRDKAFQYAYKIGVKIAFGTDNILADVSNREFWYLTRLGVSNWDAIAMATINSADLMGMTDDLGSITVGKYADIIATDKNPLDNIENIEDVRFVMKAGQTMINN